MFPGTAWYWTEQSEFAFVRNRGRFKELREAYLAELLKRPADPGGGLDRVEYWSRLKDIPDGIGFGHGIVWSVIHDGGHLDGETPHKEGARRFNPGKAHQPNLTRRETTSCTPVGACL